MWHALWYTHTMEDVRGALAANLAELRKEENLTQAEFAARFNYSDKAVSKWGRGDSYPMSSCSRPSPTSTGCVWTIC